MKFIVFFLYILGLLYTRKSDKNWFVPLFSLTFESYRLAIGFQLTSEWAFTTTFKIEIAVLLMDHFKWHLKEVWGRPCVVVETFFLFKYFFFLNFNENHVFIWVISEYQDKNSFIYKYCRTIIKVCAMQEKVLKQKTK